MTTAPTHSDAVASSDPQTEAPAQWTPDDSATLYGIDAWGLGHFDVSSEGTIVVSPRPPEGGEIDLYRLTNGLRQRGIHPPVLVRFRDMVDHRLREIKGAFQRAIDEAGYQGGYFAVYPIKVNQQRSVVEELRDFGRDLGFGLEAGSKPELLAVLGMTSGGLRDIPIICNGFKDDEYVETVILAAKLGRNITPVVEQARELDLIIKHARAHGIRPSIGVRAKPTNRGSGRWQSSGGARSKFGLSMSDLLDAFDKLKREGMSDCLRLLHFHIGSQIADIRALNAAVGELAHIYCELKNLGAGLTMIDIGGGLGVDYDGSGTTGPGSINYSLDEYASNVVHRISAACDDAQVEHPTIISESGRAMTAYSSVLIVDVPASTTFDRDPGLDQVRASLTDDTPQPLHDLVATADDLDTLPLQESLHDATQALDESFSLFTMGYMTLSQRAAAERLFAWIGRRVCEKAQAEADEAGEAMAEEIASLAEQLSDIYYINASIFQSVPDAWAIDQLFPVAPIHRLDEKPTRLATLADITCDSDGKIELFADPTGKGVRPRILLHPLRQTAEGTEPYTLGIFLVGAYQEVLGDLHNLFGDTHAVHVSLPPDSNPEHEWHIEEVIEGETVRQVLGYVGFDPAQLRRHMRADVEQALRDKTLSVEEATALLAFYDHGLDGYTYLE